MGMIGVDTTSGAAFLNVADRTYLSYGTAAPYTPSVDEEAYEVNVFQRVSSVGKDIVAGIYDMTNGVSDAVLVGQITVTATSETSTWITETLESPIQLTADVEYAIAILGVGFNGSTYGVEEANSLRRDNGQSSLPNPFVSDSVSNYVYAAHFLTRASAATATTHSIQMSEEVESPTSNYAAGFTFTKDKGGAGEEIATVANDGVTALTTTPSDVLRFSVLFPVSGAPVAGESIEVDYDATAGNIRGTASGNIAMETANKVGDNCTS